MTWRYLKRPRSPVFTAKVHGDSMVPTYESGDWLLVIRWWRPAPGQVVALADPFDGRLLVKRLGRAQADGWWVVGDNSSRSRDSREFGAVPREYLLGKVLFRYGRDR